MFGEISNKVDKTIYSLYKLHKDDRRCVVGVGENLGKKGTHESTKETETHGKMAFQGGQESPWVHRNLEKRLS